MSSRNVVSFALYLDDNNCSICNIYKYLCSVYKSVLNVENHIIKNSSKIWMSWLYFDNNVTTCINKLKQYLLNIGKGYEVTNFPLGGKYDESILNRKIFR